MEDLVEADESAIADLLDTLDLKTHIKTRLRKRIELLKTSEKQKRDGSAVKRRKGKPVAGKGGKGKSGKGKPGKGKPGKGKGGMSYDDYDEDAYE